ncbi:MAG: antitoxin VapB family protein [bacterium]
MVTKLVQLSDEAYRRLSMMKRKGESFSDVVLRTTRTRRGLEELQGTLTKEQAHRSRAMLRKIDALDRQDVKRWQSSTRRS